MCTLLLKHDFPVHGCHYVELGPRPLGLPVAESLFPSRRHFPCLDSSFRVDLALERAVSPDPPTLAFKILEKRKKAREAPKNARVFSLRGTPKILGKERTNAQKSKGKKKTKKARKSKKARIGGRIGGQGELTCRVRISVRNPHVECESHRCAPNKKV